MDDPSSTNQSSVNRSGSGRGMHQCLGAGDRHRSLLAFALAVTAAFVPRLLTLNK